MFRDLLGVFPSAKKLARLSLACLTLAGTSFGPGCSTEVQLATKGAKCEFDEQCARGLTCRCLRKRNPDEEGPDEIVAYGRCDTAETKCPTDAGPAGDTGLTDTGSVDTGALDTGGSDGSGDAPPG